jgi:ketosteroid isomerase-like protein
MRCFFLSVWVFYFSFASSQAQGHGTKAERIIADKMKAQETAWNEGRIEDFMIPYLKSDELKFIGKSGLTKGFDQTLANYKKAYPNSASMGMLLFENIHFERLSPKVYLVIGKWKLERAPELGNLAGYYSLIWKKNKGRWVIIADHSS